MARHTIKTINPFFQDVWTGKKTFEIRKNDRMYVAGDELCLQEYDKASELLLSRRILCLVTYVVLYEQFPDGIKEGYCVMGIELVHKYNLGLSQ